MEILNLEEIATVRQPNCLHNHLANNRILGDKKYLFKLLKSWKVSYKNMELDKLFEMIPQTYHITSENTIDFRHFEQVFNLN